MRGGGRGGLKKSTTPREDKESAVDRGRDTSGKTYGPTHLAIDGTKKTEGELAEGKRGNL